MDDLNFESLVEDFHLEARERLAQIEGSLLDIEKATDPATHEEHIVAIARELHTVKGNSGMMGLAELQAFAHQLEDLVAELRSDASTERVAHLLAEVDRFRTDLDEACGVEVADEEDTEAKSSGGGRTGVRVSFAALDPVVDLLSEMVIFQNRHSDSLRQALATLPKSDQSTEHWRDVEGSLKTLDRTLDQIRERVMQLRLVPLGNLFTQLRRIVFEENTAGERDIELVTRGGDTPLDRALLEVTSEVLGHLIRNAVVHGVESPSERVQAGKPQQATLTLVASAHTDEVLIDFEDDGKGIDQQALETKARKLGLDVPDGATLHDLLFLPGLSTRETAGTEAGRGMGLPAVAEAVHRHGGAVEAFSAPGMGSRFRLRLPITASILRGLIVSADGEEYALPSASVQEILGIDFEIRHRINNAGVFRWRGSLVPIVDLGAAFSTAEKVRDEGLIVIVEGDGRLRALVVDAVAGHQDVVVKSLHRIAGNPDGIAGCTILGDGRVIMILDPRELTKVSPTLEQTA